MTTFETIATRQKIVIEKLEINLFEQNFHVSNTTRATFFVSRFFEQFNFQIETLIFIDKVKTHIDHENVDENDSFIMSSSFKTSITFIIMKFFSRFSKFTYEKKNTVKHKKFKKFMKNFNLILKIWVETTNITRSTYTSLLKILRFIINLDQMRNFSQFYDTFKT